ncbi:MAG: L-seryl-tRNA(Sec) selenium transferase, partial [Gammaproteobacteria bacterium]
LLARNAATIKAVGDRLLPVVLSRMAEVADVDLHPCRSQIGSGSLPIDRLESWCLVLRPKRSGGAALARLAAAFRALPIPVIGRIEDGCLRFDLRCLDDHDAFVEQLSRLAF